MNQLHVTVPALGLSPCLPPSLSASLTDRASLTSPLSMCVGQVGWSPNAADLESNPFPLAAS